MTLFKSALAELIAQGKKTQTRRPVKTGDDLFHRWSGCEKLAVVSYTKKSNKFRLKMQVGRNYSIQYGYGRPCRWWHPESKELLSFEDLQEMKENTAGNKVDYPEILRDLGYELFRYILTDIRKEDVRSISLEDAISEGFTREVGFWKVWTLFYDKKVAHHHLTIADGNNGYVTRDSGKDYLMARPDKLYQAWAYTFEIYYGD